MKRLKMSHIPNVLTVFRILLVPVFVYLFLLAKHRDIALAVFLLAGITDIADGTLARKFGWISNIGKILDPFSDKCMQISVLVCMAVNGFIPHTVAVLLILKEMILLVGAFIALKKERVYLHSDKYGKIGIVTFYIVITLLICFENMPEAVKNILGFVLIAVMFFALIMYAVNYRKNIIQK